ncbi:hypothetical protein OG713_45860 (plasmid) [Streptomyces sp. NBC_00723]|uniref:hypothetical protein n=1 Tax=Streptomyces sp. NBC_00723 TaxID=2903673 RepID=UPI00386E4C41
MTAMAERSINDSVFVREFCRSALPELLTGAGLSDGDTHSVAVDVIRRARMLTALPADYFDVLVTPFIEEVSQHRPLTAPAWLRAAVVVAVRNSRLEDFHALVGHGQVRMGVGMSRWQVGQAPFQVARSVWSSRTTW